MRKRRWGEKGLCVFAALLLFGVFSSNAVAAMTTSFHGYIESNIVLRDVDGAQYGFFDQTEAVQQRNTLKFDIDIDPDIAMGAFRVEKVHLTFRGAYDSIFDLRANEYNITRDLGASRFDYGEEDIRFEQDLREAFIDFAYKGSMGNRAFLRAGRQLVSWGESSLETMNDIINPPDQSYQMFFQNPDDVKIPLWMGRLNFDVPRFARTSINFDLLWIPDIRPTQLAPLDSVTGQPGGMESPYIKCLPYAFLGGTVPGFLNGVTARQEVPTSNNEYGGKVSAQIGDRFNISLLYFRDVVNDAGMELDWSMADNVLNLMANNVDPFPVKNVRLTHNKQHVYGGYFSYQLLFGRFEAVVRGEVSHYTKYPVASFNKSTEGLQAKTMAAATELAMNGDFTSPVTLTTNAYVYKPVTKFMLAFDKDLRLRWFSPHDLTKITVEWLHTTINEWHDYDAIDQPQIGLLNVDRENIREQDSFYLQVMTNWWASKLSPMIVVACTPGKHGEGTTYMLRPSIKWTITPNLYTEAVVQAFMGDSWASYGFGRFVNGPSEATIKLGYEW